MNLNLNGKWKVNFISHKSSLIEILKPSFVPEGWLSADIPEDIHSTLRKAGIIRGNTYNKREDEDNWIEKYDWVYYKEFFLPASESSKSLELVFEGLDTFCEIFLNGNKIAVHNNMFLPLSLDVTAQIKTQQRNILVIRFFSPALTVQENNSEKIFSITTSDRIFSRKAQMNYSWDFCARCVTVGIWKSVFLRTLAEFKISNYYIYTDNITANKATLKLQVETDLHNKNDTDVTIAVTLSRNKTVAYTYTGSIKEFLNLEFFISNPELWWPRPYGLANLYDFKLELRKNGVLLDQKSQKFGIRKIRVLQEEQEDGVSFQFEVNNRKLFIRGANWVPANTIYTDITENDYKSLIHYAVKGNLSMLRIWGGGIYENPLFFQLCDEEGILVWIDFMFACGIYPQDNSFLKNVALEAEYIVKTYRNYTCLAIWAGDNENGQAYIWANRPYEFQNDKISNHVLKNICKQFDPERFYLTTSPGSPNLNIKGGDNPESPYQGDTHLYIMSADPGITAYRDYGKDYYKRVLGYRPRFVSEFGFISLPEKDTYFKFNFHREPLRAPQEIIKFLPFIKLYLEKGDIESVIYYSQLFNSLALKYWIEYFRSLKGTCSGTLYWKFNDPLADCPDAWMYPSHMSSIDMYRKPKMTYYYTRRAYADTIISFIERGDGLIINGVTEGQKDLEGQLRISRRDFEGKQLYSQELKCCLIKDSSCILCHLDNALITPGDKYKEYLKAEFWVNDIIYENRYFFADLCELNQIKFPSGNLKVSVAKQGSQIILDFQAFTYIRSIRIHVLDYSADYSDNYFDLDAKSAKKIFVDLADTENIENTVLYIEGENIDRLVFPICEL